MTANNYPIVTAAQAYQDGIHPGELFRAAKRNRDEDKPEMAARIRRVAFELAGLMGITVRVRAATNDNRRRGRDYGQPRGRRAG